MTEFCQQTLIRGKQVFENHPISTLGTYLHVKNTVRKYFSVLFWNLLSSLPTELKYSFYLQKTIRVFILTAVYIYCAALLQAKGHSGNN